MTLIPRLGYTAILSLSVLLLVGCGGGGGGGGGGSSQRSIPTATNWQDAELLETSPGDAEPPEIAIDGSDNALVVWSQDDGTRNNIWANRYVSGSGWQGAIQIESNNDNALHPSIAMNQNGYGVAVWYQTDGSTDAFWASRYIPGSGWQTEILIGSSTGLSGIPGPKPAVAIDHLGNIIAVWSQTDSGSPNVWSNRYTFGVGWGTQQLIEAQNLGFAITPQVAADSYGNAIAVWAYAEGATISIWSNRYEIGGAGWGTEVAIESLGGFASDPQIAIDANGNAMATWPLDSMLGGPGAAWANIYTYGAGWGSEVQIGPTAVESTYSTQVAVDGNNNFYATWDQDDSGGGPDNIWANRYAAGGPWGSAQLLENDNTEYAYYPDVAADAAGNAMAIWYQDEGAISNILASYYTAGSGWGVAELVDSEDLGYAEDPNIAFDSNGNAIAVWRQSNGTDFNIWSNRYEP